MMTLTVLRKRTSAAAASTAHRAAPAAVGATCPLCLDAPMLAGERICHGCRSEAFRLGVGRA